MLKKFSIVFMVICLLFLVGCSQAGVKVTESQLETTAVNDVANSIINNTTNKGTVIKEVIEDTNDITDENENNEDIGEEVETEDNNTEKVYYADIDIKDYGTVCVELDMKTAPISVNNFINLAGSGFYDGLTFHRIMDGFMIQGGDPEGTGMGGSSEKIKGEFSANGVENNISHVRGVISMARSNDYDSASSQFFIVQSDSLFLDGNYAGFGHVIEGMEYVDAICKDAKPTDDNGTIPSNEQPIINTIKIITEE